MAACRNCLNSPSGMCSTVPPCESLYLRTASKAVLEKANCLPDLARQHWPYGRPVPQMHSESRPTLTVLASVCTIRGASVSISKAVISEGCDGLNWRGTHVNALLGNVHA